MDRIERALRTLASTDGGAAILLAQWTFDKALLERALQSVQQTFGHYSRHDASHSATILGQIERVLGAERIARLPATDLWLLLESAYYHDAGMIVPDEQARKEWETPDFKAHLSKLRHHTDADYRAAAVLLESPEVARAAGAAWPFEVKRALFLVLADFYRSRHPERSEDAVNGPLGFGIASPRILIPTRLFAILGKICRLHGGDFSEVMSLPTAERGVGPEDAHPRFVACMLRIGDLLDLDNGRFCATMQAVFGRLPPSSLVHERKHAAITHFFVDSTRIEVTAECGARDEDAYDAMESWLSWLSREAHNISVRWSEIAPSASFGAFPTLGNISVRMPHQVLFEDGKRPMFEVDRESVLGLIRGSNLYADRFECVRELLQNAIDATLLRAWQEHPKVVESAGRQEDPLASAEPLLKRYPITLAVSEVPSRDSLAAAHQRWRVTIRDRGEGIGRDDLRFLQRVGASAKNPRRSHLRAAMPQWFRPSGIFGIGLQSVFLVAERVTIVSRALDDATVLRIELQRSSDGAGRGIVVSEVVGNAPIVEDGRTRVSSATIRSIRRKGGTIVEFLLVEPRVPPSLSYRSSERIQDSVVTTYDPVADTRLPIGAAKVIDAALKMRQRHGVPIRLRAPDIDLDGFLSDTDDPEGGAPRSRFYDKKQDIAVTIRGRNDHRVRVFYRGAIVSSRVLSHLALPGADIDLRFGVASDLLELSREAFADAARDECIGKIVEAVDKAVLHHLQERRERVASGDESLSDLSHYALISRSDELRREGNHWSAWKGVELGGRPRITLGELFKHDDFELECTAPNEGRLDSGPEWSAGRQTPTLIVEHMPLVALVMTFARALGRNASFLGTPTTPHPTASRRAFSIRVSTAPIERLPESGLRYLLTYGHGAAGRISHACPADFRGLALRDGALENSYIVGTVIADGPPTMVSPFFCSGVAPNIVVLDARNFIELVEWVTQRLATPTEAQEVARMYLRYIRYCVSLLPAGRPDFQRVNLKLLAHEAAQHFRADFG